MNQKAAVRQRIRESLRFPAEERAKKSARLCELIACEPAWIQARTVATFAPHQSEPDVEWLAPHAAGKALCFPRVSKHGLDFFHVSDLSALVVSRWKLREPLVDLAKLVPLADIDLILVPGLAFTADGCRLGRGGGYYDRLLASSALRAVKLGVCFDVQLLDELPYEPHDQRVDRVISA